MIGVREKLTPKLHLACFDSDRRYVFDPIRERRVCSYELQLLESDL